MPKPNVLLITVDTLRADYLGCYGHQGNLTPNLDRLATQSLRFERAITGGSWTQAAFPVLMTSTYASMYGGCTGTLAPERPTLAASLSAHGYTTAGFSTSPLLSHEYGYSRGFDTFVDLTPDEQDPQLRRIKGGQFLLRQPITHHIGQLLGQSLRPAKLYVTAETLTDTVNAWLDRTTTPFFAWVHYMDIHWPYHREETLTQPQEIAQAWRDLKHLHQANWANAPISHSQKEHYIQLYQEAIRYTDRHIGRLLDHLRTSGQFDDTIIILVADHGEEFLEHGRWGHWENNLYDEILQVPCLFKLPDQASGQTIAPQVRTLDLMPTILDLCDFPRPEQVEGLSLTPLWTNHPADYNAPVSLSEMKRDDWHIVAARTNAEKFIWDSRQPQQPQFFDLQSDPHEHTNIATQYPERVAFFQELVNRHLQRVTETQPTEAVLAPEMTETLMTRLRDLGYVE